MLSRAAVSLANRIGRFIPRELPRFWKGQAIGTGCALAGAALRFAVDPLVDGGIPVVLFYPFIMIAAVWGGTLAGVTALLIAMGIADYFWIQPPGFSLNKQGIITLSAFVFVSLFVIASAGVFRALVDTHRRAERQAVLLAHEFQHRTGNILGIVRAIASQTLRRAKSLDEFREVFEARITALANAQSLIQGGGDEPPDLHALIQATIRPFGMERFDVDGPNLQVPPYLATSCALLLHELGTNAIKYGALSTADGKVLIHWRAANDRVQLDWHEQGGPKVVPSNRRGFGTRLLKTAFPDEFGQASIDYDPDGIRCRMVFQTIPERADAGRVTDPRVLARDVTG